jgi:hypothetical protein
MTKALRSGKSEVSTGAALALSHTPDLTAVRCAVHQRSQWAKSQIRWRRRRFQMRETQKICRPHRGVLASRDGIAPADLRSGTGRLLVIAGVMTVVLAASASLMVYLSWKPRDAISPEVVERLDRKGQLAARRLVGEPCNRTLQGELVTSLLEHAEYGAIVAFSERTTAKYGSNEELLAAVFMAQLRSSDFVAAERTADRL